MNNYDGKIKVLQEMEKMHCKIGILEEKNTFLEKTTNNLRSQGFTEEQTQKTFKSNTLTRKNRRIIIKKRNLIRIKPFTIGQGSRLVRASGDRASRKTTDFAGERVAAQKAAFSRAEQRVFGAGIDGARGFC